MKRLLCTAAFVTIAMAYVTPASSGEIDLRGVDEPAMPVTTAAQVAPYLKSGTAASRGRVIAKLPGVPLLFYRGVTVALVPAVPYVYWGVDNGMRLGQGEPTLGEPPPFAPPLLGAIRTPASGPNGEYSFSNVPALPYVVLVWLMRTKRGRARAITPSSRRLRSTSRTAPVSYENNPVDIPFISNYTCHSSGWLYGYVTGVAGATTPASLALMYFHNDGC